METHAQTTTGGEARERRIAPSPLPAAPVMPPNSAPSDPKRKPPRDGELEETCRAVAEAAHEVAWAAYQLGRGQMPGGRADPHRMKGLARTVLGFCQAMDGLGEPCRDYDLVPVPSEDWLNQLGKVGAFHGYVATLVLAAYGARMALDPEGTVRR